jgi:hypothetical protein
MYVNAVFMVYIGTIACRVGGSLSGDYEVDRLTLELYMFKLLSLNSFMFNICHKIVTHADIFICLTEHPQLPFSVHTAWYSVFLQKLILC